MRSPFYSFFTFILSSVLLLCLAACIQVKGSQNGATSLYQEYSSPHHSLVPTRSKLTDAERKERLLLEAFESEEVYVDILASLYLGGFSGMSAGTVSEAVQPYMGVPYKWGGTTYRGLDCSGFTMLVFRKFGLRLPHSSRAQAQMGRPVPKSGLAPGDLVFFAVKDKAVIDHVGIIVGPDLMAHCSGRNNKCMVERFSKSYPSSFKVARRMKFSKPKMLSAN